MKKFFALLLVLVCILSLAACSNQQEIKDEPKEKEADGYEIVSIERREGGSTQALEYFHKSNGVSYYFTSGISHLVIVTYRNGESENIVEALNAGRAVITDLDKYGIKYYRESDRIGIEKEPYAIVSICQEGDSALTMMEPFYEDADAIYYFPSPVSAFITVTYRNGWTENIVDALEAGRATIADLDRFEIKYYREPHDLVVEGDPFEIVSIRQDGGGALMMMETFYEDADAKYSFPSPISAYITVTYRNGWSENIVDALKAGRATVSDLDNYEIKYYKEPKA